MAYQGGYGVELKIATTAPSTPVAVAKVLDVDFPAQTLELADITNHASTDGYREFIATGVRELGEFQATLLWDDSQATHAKMLTVLGTTSSVLMSIQDPADQEIIKFQAFIRQISRVAKLNDAYKAQVTIRPTGKPTIT